MVARFSKIAIFLSLLLLFHAFVFPAFLMGSPLSDSIDQKSCCRVTLLKNRDYFPVLIKTINNAKKEIVLSVFLFKTNGYHKSYNDIILSHLVRAAERGVNVKVILETSRDLSQNLASNNRKTGDRLKKGGIAVYFDHPTTKNSRKSVYYRQEVHFPGKPQFDQFCPEIQ
jgi:sugar-specific transcriptional regulator TrmB